MTDTIPSNYFTIEDEHGANDVPGQVDLTQMGRDDSDPNLYQLFWSWDSISAWTGSGQTGDACALFDTDGDTMINYAVCARVSNFNADPNDVRIVPKSANEQVHLFACSDKKNDRCTNPSPMDSRTISAGPFDPATTNLITHTDPFETGESYAHDTTIRLEIPAVLIPGNEVLTNVCSYPSAGNGGNNNPFDCIVTPGGGYILIVKDAGVDVTSPNFTFDVHRGTTFVANRTIAGSDEANEVPVLVGTNIRVTETAVPTPWQLTGAECRLNNGAGAVTGSFVTASNWVTGITVESGKITVCTFTDRLQTGTLVVKKIVVNDNGGLLEADDFSYSLDGNLTSTAFGTDPDAAANPLRGSSGDLTMNAGSTFNVTEPPVPGYTATLSPSCTNGTIVAGQTVTCTITNDDNAPSLTLVKEVDNDFGGTALATDWDLSATGTGLTPTNLSGETPVSSSTGFKADTYTLAEANGPSGYTAGDWVCEWDEEELTGSPTQTATTVTVGLGQAITCTITNSDGIASPSGTTVQSWVLHDTLTISGIRPGAPDADDADVTFYLFSDAGCSVAVSPAAGETVDVVNGVASTSDGFAVDDPGSYYWIASYSGDEYNNGFDTLCGAEITEIQATDDR